MHHSNLRQLSFDDQEHPGIRSFTGPPSPGVTIPLKGWITECVQRLPRLSSILHLGAQETSTHNCEANDPDANTALHITTFTNGIDTLFHFRQQLQYFNKTAVRGFE